MTTTTFILLVAGLGSRMGPLTQDNPKALVELGLGMSILDANIRSIRSRSGGRIVLVGGYLVNRLREFAERNIQDGPITVQFNSAYSTEGPLRSIWVGLGALEASEQSVVVANGDTILSQDALNALISSATPGIVLLTSPEVHPEADDMIVTLGLGSAISAVEKSVVDGPALISAGCLIAHGTDALSAVRRAVDAGLVDEAEADKQLAWHSIFRHLTALGHAAYPLPVPRSWWQEFDSPSCVDRFNTTVRRMNTGKTDKALRLTGSRDVAGAAEARIYERLLRFDVASALSVLRKSTLPTPRKRAMKRGIRHTRQAPEFTSGQVHPAESVAAAGTWWIKEKGLARVLRGQVDQPAERVFIFADGCLLRTVNTSTVTTAYGTTTRFRFKMWPSLLRGLKQKTTIAVTSSAGPLLHVGGGEYLDYENSLGRGRLFRRLRSGYIVTKKGGLRRKLTARSTWGELVLDAYQKLSSYMKLQFDHDLFIIYGTLLGYCREKGFLPGDDDFDAAYFSRERSPEGVKAEMICIMRKLRLDGFDFSLSAKAGFFKFKLNGIRFDVFPAWSDDGRLWMHNTTSIVADKAMILPVQHAEFMGRRVAVPANPEAFLDAKYGDWRTPDPGYTPKAAPGTDAYLSRARLTAVERAEFISEVTDPLPSLLGA